MFKSLDIQRFEINQKKIENIGLKCSFKQD